MNIDDSYEVRRQTIFSSRIGLRVSVDQLSNEVPNAYSDPAAVRAYLQSEAVDILDDISEFTVTHHSMGRSGATLTALVVIGSGLSWLVSRAKNIDEGIKTIRKWSVMLKAWKHRLGTKGRRATFTVEALKIFCVADLYERFDIATDPYIGLIRTDAASTRSYDGAWIGFGPVYVFIPDRRKKVTHLYAIAYDGEILYRGEIPPFELESPLLKSLESEGSSAQLYLPGETTDPDIEKWKQSKTEHSDPSESPEE